MAMNKIKKSEHYKSVNYCTKQQLLASVKNIAIHPFTTISEKVLKICASLIFLKPNHQWHRKIANLMVYTNDGKYSEAVYCHRRSQVCLYQLKLWKASFSWCHCHWQGTGNPHGYPKIWIQLWQFLLVDKVQQFMLSSCLCITEEDSWFPWPALSHQCQLPLHSSVCSEAPQIVSPVLYHPKLGSFAVPKTCFLLA